MAKSCKTHKAAVHNTEERPGFIMETIVLVDFYPMITGAAVYCIPLVVETLWLSTRRIQVLPSPMFALLCAK